MLAVAGCTVTDRRLQRKAGCPTLGMIHETPEDVSVVLAVVPWLEILKMERKWSANFCHCSISHGWLESQCRSSTDGEASAGARTGQHLHVHLQF